MCSASEHRIQMLEYLKVAMKILLGNHTHGMARARLNTHTHRIKYILLHAYVCVDP